MGFPIALSLFGPEGLALSVMLNIGFNATVYTIGAIEISCDNPAHQGGSLDVKSIIFSNVNYSIILSLIFYFGRINLPEMIAAPVNFLSGITTPLSMMIIGIALSGSKGRELFTDKDAWTCSAFGLLIFPLALLLVLKFIPLSQNFLVRAVLVLVVAMPAPSVTAVLCGMYGGNMKLAAKIMFIQNLLCLVSIPLVLMMLS